MPLRRVTTSRSRVPGSSRAPSTPELAKKFIEFLISREAQEKLPLNQWMYPVNRDVKLPEVFKYAVRVDKPATVDPAEIEKNYKTWLDQWTQLMVEGKSPDEILGKTGTRSDTKESGGGICGPAFVAALALVPPLLRRRR